MWSVAYRGGAQKNLPRNGTGWNLGSDKSERCR